MSLAGIIEGANDGRGRGRQGQERLYVDGDSNT